MTRAKGAPDGGRASSSCLQAVLLGVRPARAPPLLLPCCHRGGDRAGRFFVLLAGPSCLAVPAGVGRGHVPLGGFQSLSSAVRGGARRCYCFVSVRCRSPASLVDFVRHLTDLNAEAAILPCCQSSVSSPLSRFVPHGSHVL